MDKKTFISEIAQLILKYAPQYGINYVSPIIAQACCESAYGNSRLSKVYHNYFGMKTGRSYKGRSVNLKTGEEYSPGVHTTITARFRVYSSMEEGVKGYFEFIQMKRYQNLRNATSAGNYCELLKADGWATSSTYVMTLKNIIKLYNLEAYDSLVGNVATANEIINTKVSKKPITADVVNAVIRGNYGNGATRKARLEAAGYDADEVQRAVNKRIKKR